MLIMDSEEVGQKREEIKDNKSAIVFSLWLAAKLEENDLTLDSDLCVRVCTCGNVILSKEE